MGQPHPDGDPHGHGSDGLAGARLLHAAGGRVLAQDAATSVVWGMPGAVVKDGVADAVLPLDDVAPAVLAALEPRLTAGMGAR